MKKLTWLGKGLRWFGIVLLTLAVIAVFVLAVLIGMPQNEGKTNAAEQPLNTTGLQRLSVAADGDILSLRQGFDAPVMYFVAGAGPEFREGSAYDVPFEDGYARVISLTYALPDNSPVTVQSVYPARAVSLLATDGWMLTSGEATMIAGVRCAKMTGSGAIRYHGADEEGLYAITMPNTDGDTIRALLRTLQRTAD